MGFALVVYVIAFSNAQRYRPANAPQAKAGRQDTVVSVIREVEPPNTVFGKILHYLSPVKFYEEDSVYALYDDSAEFIVHEENHSNFARRYDIDTAYTEGYWDRQNNIRANGGSYPLDTSKVFFEKNFQVYGYHPYWMGSAYENYNYNVLTRIGYFSYELNPKTGNPLTTNYWNTSNLIDLAHSYGTKVDLVITNFGYEKNREFLSNKRAQNVMIQRAINLVRNRGGDGLNLNFEEVPKQQKNAFTAFVTSVSTALKTENPEYKLTVTIPAIGWRSAYDVPQLADTVDYFFMMGYDYHNRYSKVAGPNTVLFSGADWTPENISTTVENYLEVGAKAEKLILGVPHYGHEWQTESGEVPSKVISYIGPRTYSYISSNYADKYRAIYDSTSHAIYYAYRDSTFWVQVWGENELTLATKYDFIREKGLGGAGIWALGYDSPYPELWTLLDQKFRIIPPKPPNYDSLLRESLAYSVTRKSLTEVHKTSPDYVDRFNDQLSTGWKVFSLLFAIILLFAILGYVIAIADFDVRFVLFTQEVRVYTFFILIVLIGVVILRIQNIVQPSYIVLIAAALLGILAYVFRMNIAKLKRDQSGRETP